MNYNFNEKNSNAVLHETQELFQSQGMSIIGEGFKEIATNPVLLEQYIDSLTQGVNAGHVETMRQLMANSNKQMLTESSTTGIAPIASLSMPVIRKLWPKFALKEALKEEVAKSPRFVVTYTKPYLFRGDANGAEDRMDLPFGLKSGSALSEKFKKDACVRVIAAADLAAPKTVNFREAGAGASDKGVAKIETASNVKVLPLDRDFYVEIAGKKYALDINNTVVADVADATVLVRVDLANAVAKVACIGTIAEDVKLVAPLTTEYNEQSWSVAFDIEREDIQIPTGEHLNAPLPIEALQDMMALYQIDGTKETTDLMTNVFAMKLDLDVLEFLNNCWANLPSKYSKPQFAAMHGAEVGAEEFTLTFDVRPAAGYAGGPKAWREELKPQIDFLAQKIKNATYLNTGMFVIVANPLDAQIIANIDWKFRGGQGSNVDGVDVDYSVGTYVGANSYKVIASQNVPQGAMYLLFLPSSDKQMTFKYYPYSFCVEHGYIDPNRSRVPSIMMTKRHTMHQVISAIGMINIVNNDGLGSFAPYVQYKNWDEGDFAEVETYGKK